MKYNVVGTSVATSADGTIEVEKTDQGNYTIVVKLEHLPPPARIGGQHYVVWLSPTGGQPRKLGTLEFDEDDRTGVMTATTTSPSFDVTVTAEASDAVTVPGNTVVIQQTVTAAGS